MALPLDTPFETDKNQKEIESIINKNKSNGEKTGKKSKTATNKPSPLTKKDLQESLKKAKSNLDLANAKLKALDKLKKPLDKIQSDIDKAEADIKKLEKGLPNGYIDENGQPKAGPIPPGVNGTLAKIDFARNPPTSKVATQNQIDKINGEIAALETKIQNLEGLKSGNSKKYEERGGDAFYNSVKNRITKDETYIKGLENLIENYDKLADQGDFLKQVKEAVTAAGGESGQGGSTAGTTDDPTEQGSSLTDTDEGKKELSKELLKTLEPGAFEEEITKGKFNVAKIKAELAAALEGKSVNDGKVTIKNVDDYDISDLRGTFNTSKLLADPIAFMGNLVWNYDVSDPTTLVFRYALPQNIITTLNSKTNQFLIETAKRLDDKAVLSTSKVGGGTIIDEDPTTNDGQIVSYSKSIADETGESPDEVYTKLRNYYFITIFTRKIRAYFKEQLGPEKFAELDKRLVKEQGLTTLREEPDGTKIVRAPTSTDLAFTYSFKYIRYFWLWWSQVFYVNVPLKSNSLYFVIDKNNVVPVQAGLYFLERYYGIGNPLFDIIDRLNGVIKARDEDKTLLFGAINEKYNYDGFLLGGYINYQQKFVNTNNYIKVKDKPTLEYTNVINVSNSPFFSGNEELLTPSEKKSLSNTKKVKVCKESAKNSLKKETGLKLFYKEGNDDVLDKSEPSLGLGCDDSAASEWDQAKNIFFKKSTIKKSLSRVNFQLPYYNVLGLKTNNMVPPELDLFARGLETSNGSGLNEFKYRSAFAGLSTRLMLNVADKRSGDVLMDEQLKTSFQNTPSLKLLSSYFDKNPNWGPQYIIDKIPFFNPETTPYFQLATLPYISAFNVGYQINKKPINSLDTIQTFYVNGIDDAISSYLDGANDLAIYDSQIKYGSGYSYDVKQIISFVNIQYSYNNVDLNESSLKEFEQAGKPIVKFVSPLNGFATEQDISFQLAAQNVSKIQLLADIPGGFGKFGKEFTIAQDQSLDDVINFEFRFNVPGKRKIRLEGYDDNGNVLATETIDITVVKDGGLLPSNPIPPSEPPATAEDGEDGKVAVMSFDYSDIIYLNKIKVIQTGEVENSVSYVDLPPPAPYVRLYPQRGVANKLLFSFDNYSQAKSIEAKVVPKKYWTDGWKDARQFFIELQENSPDTLAQLGVVSVNNSDDEMYFYRQNISKVFLYASKGKKPKDVLEMKKFKEINVVTDGFTKEVEIEPNVKYYFATKAVSFTGLESYYSEIYEVELVEDGGAVFPLINVVELEEKKKRRTKIKLSKKFRIEPAILQQAPNPSKDDVGYLTPSVFLSAGDTKPRFKVRLTSKKTGKKIDFNVIYKKFFNKKSETAGDLNLNVVDKSKILISYKTSFVPPVEEEDEDNLDFFKSKPPADNLDLGVRPKPPEPPAAVNQTVTPVAAPTQTATSSTVKPKSKTLFKNQTVVPNPCCEFYTKEPLFAGQKIKNRSSWELFDPNPKLLGFEVSVETRELNKKLLKINDAIRKLDDDEDTVFAVLKSMSLAEKCYMCKRQKEYAGPVSMLAAIQSQFTASEFNDVLNILDCQGNFGFASKKGGNPKSSSGIELNSGLSAKKCNQEIVETKVADSSGKLPQPQLDEDDNPIDSPFKKSPV